MQNNTNKDKTRFQIRIVLLVFALLGLGLSLFLVYEYSQPEPIGCVISIGADNSCETVRQSPYSKLLGIDLPIYGTLFFLSVNTVLIYFLVRKIGFKGYDKILTALLTFGILFETVYTYIQVAILNAICSWCILTEMTVFCLFIINLVENFTYRKVSPKVIKVK